MKFDVGSYCLGVLYGFVGTSIGVAVASSYKRRKAVEDKTRHWNTLWAQSETLPYDVKWGNAWTKLYQDDALVAGKIYRCFGPDGYRAIIVCTALYGPLALYCKTGCASSDIYVTGHPTLMHITVEGQPVFGTPVEPKWLKEVLNPTSWVYSMGTENGFKVANELREENLNLQERILELNAFAKLIEIVEVEELEETIVESDSPTATAEEKHVHPAESDVKTTGKSLD